MSLSFLCPCPFQILLHLRRVVLAVHIPHEDHAPQGDEPVCHLKDEDQGGQVHRVAVTEANLTVEVRRPFRKSAFPLVRPLAWTQLMFMPTCQQYIQKKVDYR